MGGGKEALGEDDQAGGPDKMASNDSSVLLCTHFIRHHPREGASIIIRSEAHQRCDIREAAIGVGITEDRRGGRQAAVHQICCGLCGTPHLCGSLAGLNEPPTAAGFLRKDEVTARSSLS